MKTYSCPQIIIDLCYPSEIIALSLIDGGAADQDIPVQVKENSTFASDWGDIFAGNDQD